MNKEEFYNNLLDLGIELSNNQKENLEKFAKLLIEYNKHTNITSIIDINEIYLKHFYDSLTLIKAINLNDNLSVLDVGSGGGFPGIVLAIVFPNLKITLLDSNNKKSKFQEYIINKLNLKNVIVVNDRAENYFKTSKKYDLVVARAVANLTILSELCIPFVKNNGLFIAMKGNFDEELKDAEYAIEFLGGSIKAKISFELPILGDKRALIVISKEKESPDGYPRTYDKIMKKPLKNK